MREPLQSVKKYNPLFYSWDAFVWKKLKCWVMMQQNSNFSESKCPEILEDDVEKGKNYQSEH